MSTANLNKRLDKIEKKLKDKKEYKMNEDKISEAVKELKETIEVIEVEVRALSLDENLSVTILKQMVLNSLDTELNGEDE